MDPGHWLLQRIGIFVSVN